MQACVHTSIEQVMRSVKLDYGLVVTAPPTAPLRHSVKTGSHCVETGVQKVVESGLFLKDMGYSGEV